MSTRQKHILVVDDELHILNLFEDELTDAGYRVTAASSGLEALERIKDDPPDLAVLDIRMPDMHGLELLEKVREMYAYVPVIMCTAVQGLKDEYTVWKAKVSAYLTKPVDLDELLGTVRRVLRDEEAEEA
jgi:DNA-binding response OmpR family regulator